MNDISVTLLVTNFDLSIVIDCNDLQLSNIPDISVTFLVSKLSKDKLFKEKQPENM